MTPTEYLHSQGMDLDKTILISCIDGVMRQPNLLVLLEEYAKVKDDPAGKTVGPIHANYLFVKGGGYGEHIKIMFDDITYIEARGDYMTIYTTKTKHVTHSTLKALVEKLPKSQFSRCHNSFIVNLNAISFIRETCIHLENSKTIPLGEKYKGDFRKAVL